MHGCALRRLALTLALFILMLFGLPASADARELPVDAVEVTAEDATGLAQQFFNDIFPVNVVASDAIKLYGPDGYATGYVVNALDDGRPHGYVVYDFSREWCIAKFCYSEGASFLSDLPSRYCDNDELRLVAVDALSYALLDSTGSGIMVDSGESVSLPGVIDAWSTPSDRSSRSSDPTTFDEVFTDHATLYKQGYKITSANALSGYSNPTQLFVEVNTGRYACEVSSMYTMCSYYVDMGGLSNIKSQYVELWDLSDTKVYSNNGEVTYGSTYAKNVPGAITEFCKRRGVSLQATYKEYPGWSSFKQAVDSKQMSEFAANLRSNGNGHAMAVVGYMTLKNDYTGANYNALMVCDGWDAELEILPYDVTPYRFHSGVFCNRG